MGASFKPGTPPVLVAPGQFRRADHFYPRVLNAQIHPSVREFFHLDCDRMVARYCFTHPTQNAGALRDALRYQPKYMRWGGADLVGAIEENGARRMVVIEVNSCPSGMKSMPTIDEDEPRGSYPRLLSRTFLPALKARAREQRLPAGGLAVIHDKNTMEASGYAAALAELTGEPVYLAGFFDGDHEPTARFRKGVLQIFHGNRWRNMRAAFRYVTQRPWNRIPTQPKTFLMNPVVACLAGGRNKLMAARAYDLFNAEHSPDLAIRAPETVFDVEIAKVPLSIEAFGGRAVIKVPYQNAGMGVFTVTSQAELDAFMAHDHAYKHFVVQSLIGHHAWSSKGRFGALSHIGTIPDGKGDVYAFDMRMQVGATTDGFVPIAAYARRARAPLRESLEHAPSSWDMLGTNLSLPKADGSWDVDHARLLLLDRYDFNGLGIGLDDLIEGFVQSCLSVTAIDQMAIRMMNEQGALRPDFFSSINSDEALLSELLV